MTSLFADLAYTIMWTALTVLYGLGAAGLMFGAWLLASPFLPWAGHHPEGRRARTRKR